MSEVRKGRIKKFFVEKADYIILFILNATEMVLELVASRLLSPYFGNSNFVWTAIIGIILLAASLGNVIGGKLAARTQSRFWTGLMLLVAAVWIALIPLISLPILQLIKDDSSNIGLSAVISSIIFFLVPSTILGIMTPIIMKERIGDNGDGKDKAKESGRITAIGAIGSLIGTFVGGFWIIPTLGTKMIFAILAIVITVVVLIMRPCRNVRSPKLKRRFCLVLAATLAIDFISIIVVGNSKNDGVNMSIDTEYGRIIIEEGKYIGENVLYYRQSGAYSSATYLDEDRKFELVFKYLEKYDLMFDFLDVKSTAMIGGAAYQYPKYFISHFPEKTMDVIEIDPVSTEIAKKYFYLDDLIKTYGEDRLGLYNEDGRVFMARTDKTYDAILNDAFSGEVPVGTLATVEAARTIKERLRPSGVYMSNVLGAASGKKGRFLRAEVKTLRKVFQHVYVVPVREEAKMDQYVNWMVIATDGSHVPDKVVELEITDEDPVLTDDYNPVDDLVSDEYYD